MLLRKESKSFPLTKKLVCCRVVSLLSVKKFPSIACKEKAKTALEDILTLVENNDRTFGSAGGEEYLTFHYLTEMLMQMGGDNWVRWYPTVRDKLIDVQNRDGSWTGHHCITSRTFSTACALMVLSAPNRFLPISQV